MLVSQRSEGIKTLLKNDFRNVIYLLMLMFLPLKSQKSPSMARWSPLCDSVSKPLPFPPPPPTAPLNDAPLSSLVDYSTQISVNHIHTHTHVHTHTLLNLQPPSADSAAHRAADCPPSPTPQHLPACLSVPPTSFITSLSPQIKKRNLSERRPPRRHLRKWHAFFIRDISVDR